MDRWFRATPIRAPRRRLLLKPLEVDAIEVRQRIAAGVLDEADLLLVLVQDLDRQAEAWSSLTSTLNDSGTPG